MTDRLYPYDGVYLRKETIKKAPNSRAFLLVNTRFKWVSLAGIEPATNGLKDLCRADCYYLLFIIL